MPITIEGKLDGSGRRIAIAAARFNEYLVESLLRGALDSLRRHGVADQDITVVRVPGSFELPFTCRKLAETGSYDAVIALGVVIRGATSHYDLVCGEAASGCAAAMRDTGVPIIFGVVTTENIEQAIERSGSKAGNRGADAAVAALEMTSVIAEIGRLRR